MSDDDRRAVARGAIAARAVHPVPDDADGLAQKLLWARIQAFESMDAKLEDFEAQLAKVLEIHQLIRCEIADEVNRVTATTTEAHVNEPATSTRSLAHYLDKVIRYLLP